ncbi:MAG: hypothetical protein H7274_04335 [Rhodoferax sp.]|nr:hypothetical protein [Rhodoferax sp.]
MSDITEHKRVVKVTFTEKQFLGILANEVADDAGIDLLDDHVSMRGFITTNDSVGSGIERHVTIEIVVNLLTPD